MFAFAFDSHWIFAWLRAFHHPLFNLKMVHTALRMLCKLIYVWMHSFFARFGASIESGKHFINIAILTICILRLFRPNCLCSFHCYGVCFFFRIQKHSKAMLYSVSRSRFALYFRDIESLLHSIWWFICKCANSIFILYSWYSFCILYSSTRFSFCFVTSPLSLLVFFSSPPVSVYFFFRFGLFVLWATIDCCTYHGLSVVWMLPPNDKNTRCKKTTTKKHLQL